MHIKHNKITRDIVALSAGSLIFSGAAMAENPKNKPDDAWISVSGTVVSSSDESFMLDYGSGTIFVEMDDWDWYDEAAGIIDGDKVTVNGRIDDDLYETKKIEAGSVYVENLNTYFYASAADEEDVPSTLSYPNTSVLTGVEFVGKIVKVSGREFTLDTGSQKLKVDTSEMVYNPMDNFGYQQLDVGDRVRVSGEIDYKVFDKQELEADIITTLVEDKGKRSS